MSENDVGWEQMHLINDYLCMEVLATLHFLTWKEHYT